MFVLQAPVPAIQTATYLPNPQLGDSQGNVLNVDIKRSMNGATYSYVKTRNREKLIWAFRLSQHKGMELMEFYRSYKASQIKVTDHLGNVFIGYFTSNPLEIEATNRSVDSPGNDTKVSVQIEFEGEKQ